MYRKPVVEGERDVVPSARTSADIEAEPQDPPLIMQVGVVGYSKRRELCINACVLDRSRPHTESGHGAPRAFQLAGGGSASAAGPTGARWDELSL